MMSLCYVAVLLWNAPVDGPGLSEGMAVELKALEARQALRNGVIEVSVEFLKVTGPPGAGPLHVPPVDLKLTFDGNRRFVESREQGRTITERRMFDGTLYIVEHGDSSRAERFVIDREGLALSKQYMGDPRLLGVYPRSLGGFGGSSIETILGRTDRTEERVSIEQMSGRSVTHVSRKLLSGQVQSDLWIAPELGHSVVRVETIASTIIRDELLCEYDKPFDGVWFPQRITYRQYRLPDNQLTYEDVGTVKSAVFNRGIAPALFTLPSFKPNVGDIVREDGKLKAWNGKQLVSTDDGTIITPQARSLIGSWPWFTVAVFLAIAAFVVLRRSLYPS